MSRKITIAIDGYSSTGKSTMAKALAQHLGYLYVDSGAMYRAVTWWAMNNGWIQEHSIHIDQMLLHLPELSLKLTTSNEGFMDVWVNGEKITEAIRSMDVAQRVSQIASIAEIRHFLVAKQQQMGREKGVVMDGRDIGTVVFPDAELKVFVQADAQIRAKRRFDELKAKGQIVDFQEILANVNDRDHQDTHRAVSPLVQAADARVLDNTQMGRAEQLALLIDWADQAIHQ
ncbi:MAG: (d)CMP kinase [Flavobacteriaceae bacterium]